MITSMERIPDGWGGDDEATKRGEYGAGVYIWSLEDPENPRRLGTTAPAVTAHPGISMPAGAMCIPRRCRRATRGTSIRLSISPIRRGGWSAIDLLRPGP